MADISSKVQWREGVSVYKIYKSEDPLPTTTLFCWDSNN